MPTDPPPTRDNTKRSAVHCGAVLDTIALVITAILLAAFLCWLRA